MTSPKSEVKFLSICVQILCCSQLQEMWSYQSSFELSNSGPFDGVTIFEKGNLRFSWGTMAAILHVDEFPVKPQLVFRLRHCEVVQMAPASMSSNHTILNLLLASVAHLISFYTLYLSNFPLHYLI